MKTRIKHFLFYNRYIFAAFFMPVILVAIAFAVTGIYPFGSQQIPVIDMYHQYVPFLSELQHKLQTADTLLYTWDGAAGSNFWNLIAYYGASPLNLILILFPATGLMEGVTTILLIKIGLAGAFMAIYLRETYKTCDLGTSAFATLYALCAYVMGYFWCIMWLDAVLLLPLVIMGLNRIVNGRSPVLYVICLALTVFCNYYISIMVCIFILCYYPVTYFIHTKGASAMSCLVTTLKSVGYSFLAIAMAAVMLLPTYYSMQNTYYISSDIPEEWTFYNNPMQVLNQLLPNAQLTFREGLPNICCGLIVVILVVFYVADKTIKLREKSLNLGLLAFLLLCMNVNKLDFIWHGFHFPNQLPFRYSFVVSFLLVGMAYKEFLGLSKVKPSTIWAAMAGILGWCVLGQQILIDDIDNSDVYFYMGGVLLVAYTVILMTYRKGIITRKHLTWMVTFVVAVELGFTVASDFKLVGNTDRDYYFENYSDVRKLVEMVDDEFARVEVDDNFILNTPAFYHYKGVSQFSSSINSNASFTMENIGLEGEPGRNRYNYVLTDPVTNAILDVKYIIGKSSEIEDSDLTFMAGSGDSYLYENKYAPGIGYITGQDIWSWDVNLDNPFSVLDDYVRAATEEEVEDVFIEAKDPQIDAENMIIDYNGDEAWSAEADNDSEDSTVKFTYTAEQTGKYYVFCEADNCREITAYTDSSEDGIFIREDCGSVVNIGEVEEGGTFSVELGYDAGNMGNIVCHAVSIDQEKWDKAYGIIAREPLIVDEWSERSIKGRVDASEVNSVLVTSIPYEKGWSLKVDGRSKHIDQLAGEVFIAIDLASGEHEIELSFMPPGFIPGLLLTILSILLLAGICLLLPKIMRRRAMRQSEPPELPGSDQEGSDYNKEDIDSLPEEE